MAGVTFRQVAKEYPTGLAVRDFSLEVQDGEFVALVGPSGCGKSTTLRMVAGLEEITSGEILIGGRCVNDVEPQDRDIAMVFQSYALYPHKTVRENMAFSLRMRKVPATEIESRVREAAELLGLGDQLDRYPRELSGGQRQRVAMGRALVRKPAVFLFDEPLSNLDAKLRHQVRKEIAQLHRRLRSTVLYVTHDQLEAMTLADRLAVMDKGVLQQVGSPSEVYNCPANTFVAGFVGSPAMNFLTVAAPALSGQGLFVAPGLLPAAANRNLSLGVRPEHLHPETAQDPLRLTLEVDLVETLGAELLVSGSAAGQAVMARLGAETQVRVGEKLALSAARERLHLFDGSRRIELA